MKKLILSILVLGFLGIGVWAGPESTTLYDMMMKDKSLLEIGEENIAKEKARIKKLREKEEKRSKTKEVLEFRKQELLFKDRGTFKNDSSSFKIANIKNVFFYDKSNSFFYGGNLSVTKDDVSVHYHSFDFSYLQYSKNDFSEILYLYPEQKQKLIALLDKFFKWKKIAKKEKILLAHKKIGIIVARYMYIAANNPTISPLNPLPIPIYYETIDDKPAFVIDASSLGKVEMENGEFEALQSLYFSDENAHLLKKAITKKEINKVKQKVRKRKQKEDALFN